MDAALEFLEGFNSFFQCPEFDFEQCYWRFIAFEERPGTFERSNADFAHKSFDAHATRFAPGLKKLLEAHADVLPYGMSVLPSTRKVVQETSVEESRSPRVQKTKDSTYKYDVALSFAGTERPLSEKLAKLLRENGIEVFYDAFYPEHL